MDKIQLPKDIQPIKNVEPIENVRATKIIQYKKNN